MPSLNLTARVRHALRPRSAVPTWTLAAGLWALVPLSACGGGQTRGHPLDRSWSDADGAELAAFQASWQPSSRPTAPSVAVAVLDRKTLLGRKLDGGAAWRFEHPIESRPAISGEVVVGIGGGYLFALDAATGEPIWRRRALGYLRGASDDGATTMASLASLSGERSIVLAVARDGSVVRQIDVPVTIGRPVVFDGFAFLPWNRHLVVVFDLMAGREAARVVSHYPLSQAFVTGDSLYFGGEVAVRFDDKVVAARDAGGTVARLPPRRFPGRPPWFSDGTRPLPLASVREDTVRFYAEPNADARIDRYAVTYFGLTLGLGAPDGRTEWVNTSKAVQLAATVARDTLAVCDEEGDIRWLDRHGITAASTSLWGSAKRRPLLSCVLQSEVPPDHVVTQPEPLAAQLKRALRLEDPRVLPVQYTLLEDLAALAGADATAALIAVASRPVVRRPSGRDGLVEAARRHLAGRRATPWVALQALRTASSRVANCGEFCEISEPIGALAQIMAAVGQREAAEPLRQLIATGRLDAAQERAVRAALLVLSTSPNHEPLEAEGRSVYGTLLADGP